VQTGPVVATCPQGELALSGGWDIPSNGARVFAAKVVNNGWAVSVSTSGQASTTVTSYVECLRGATGTSVIQRAVTLAIAPTIASFTVDNANIYSANCQQNEGLVGFGFDFGASGAGNLEFEASVPSEILHDISWSFKTWNYDTVPHNITYIITCATTTLHGEVAYPTHASTGTLLYAGMTGSTSVSCPSGTILAGGGFAYTLRGERAQLIGNEYGLHATATGWQSSLMAFTSYGLVAIYPEAIAVCLSLT
jgi:hypothetical protein